MRSPKRLALSAAEFAGVALVYLAAAGLMTWPAIAHIDEIIIGGGELGGWLWRYWWHFTEVDALVAGDFGVYDSVYAYLSLGRHPETGNILDVLWISWPLSKLFGIPTHYNLKIFVILVGDGLIAYLFARSFTPYRLVALAAGLLAVVNPVNVHDLYGSGLRQVVLWFLLLFPLLLDRAERRERPWTGIAAGVVLGLVGAFYWFYGLFAGMFLVLWSVDLVWRERRRIRIRRLLRWAGPMLLAAVLVGGFFVAPYVLGESGATAGGQQKLPELSFFLTFPEYDVIRDVPLRPSTYEENVLSSLNRTISSSWSVDYLFNPGHKRALPLIVFLGGVLPALLLKPGIFPRSRFWLVVFTVFFVGTLGPFVKWAGPANSWGEVVLLPLSDGHYVIRMPFTLMFKWVPGMSRMFAPYRMGSMVVVASVALVAMGLSRITNGKLRATVALAAMGFTLFQANFRWHNDGVDHAEIAPKKFNPAIPVSAIQVPDFYEELPDNELAGIIELPLEQQQDLLNYYQLVHGRKVFRSWATKPAVPPVMRDEGGGGPGAQLRYLAQDDLDRGSTGELFMELSRKPEAADLDNMDMEDFSKLIVAGNYQHLVVHERGFYLIDPQRGPLLYNDVVRRLSSVLGVFPEEVIELAWIDYPGNPYDKAWGPVRVAWSSYEVLLPDEEMPNRFFMSIFDLSHIHEAWDGPNAEELLPKRSGGSSGGGGAGDRPEHQHVEMPPGAPLPGSQ